ncbi:MAG: AAA family ATPase, partial [Clostridia bacterium]|nr:AAA family ATPase [Clostridia bacterium]
MSIKECAKMLLLSYTFQNSEQILREAQDTKMSHEEFLTDLLEKEAGLRRENGVKRRIRQARFPHKKYLIDFKTEHMNKVLSNK